MIKLIICDDYVDLCNSYKTRLELEPDIEVCATFNSAADLLAHVDEFDVDILLLDIQMETPTAGVDVIPRVMQKCPDLKIIMLSGHDIDSYIFDSFTNGAVNYILKDDPTDVIISTIRDAHEDRQVLSSHIAARIISTANKMHSQHQSILYVFKNIHRLTKTEFEVLSALHTGQSYAQLAADRFVEENTIRKIVSNILHKFECKSMKVLLAQLEDLQIFDFLK